MRHDKIGSVMTTDVVRAEYGTPFKEVARLLAEHRISGLPVVDEDDKVIGVLSETDLLAHTASTPDPYEPDHHTRFTGLIPGARRRAAKKARTAGGLMTVPAVTVHADDTLVQATRTMAQRHVDRLPVLDEEDRLVGIVTRGDLLKVFLRPDEDIRREVIDEVLVRSLWLAPRSVEVSVTEGVVTLTGSMERKSETVIAVSMTRRLDGVVDVVSHLTHRLDDARLRPDDRAPHGVAEDWLRRL
ncbi:CBS domain-containing protein [Streptomyces aureus]|uniref:CBS domain-containing protein n=1 Tax=Streptomyces aureus TaxID=193461 RepID=UPI00055FCB06|nr:CBS domain-containing protein [Streptomyces aureus]